MNRKPTNLRQSTARRSSYINTYVGKDLAVITEVHRPKVETAKKIYKTKVINLIVESPKKD
jgi:hypothetical protein